MPVANRARRASAAIVLAFSLIAAPLAVSAAEDGGWIGTWSASAMPVWGADFFLPVAIPRALRDQTIRQVARVSLGGKEVRVQLTNEYGDVPLHIGAATIGIAGENGAAEGVKPLTFAGQTSTVIPAGAPLWSDPVELPIEALSSVAVSLYLPDITPTTTWHAEAAQTAWIADGDVTGAATIEPTATVTSRIFLSGILVDAAPDARAIVAFGDSITDGAASTVDGNARWPDVLAERVAETGADVAVLNQGIGGDRVLRTRMGESALTRFDRDVLSQPRADTVILMMGINDIGWPGTLLAPGEPAPTAEAIIAGYEQLIDRAHAHGLTIVGATLTPFEDSFAGGPLFGFNDPDKEAKRAAINDWIRTSGRFDGVIDFDKLAADPANPLHIKAEFDSGDHLHPNDAGYAAMGNAVDLKLLGIEAAQ
jgi:lysophospholipase L1-like esterase